MLKFSESCECNCTARAVQTRTGCSFHLSNMPACRTNVCLPPGTMLSACSLIVSYVHVRLSTLPAGTSVDIAKRNLAISAFRHNQPTALKWPKVRGSTLCTCSAPSPPQPYLTLSLPPFCRSHSSHYAFTRAIARRRTRHCSCRVLAIAQVAPEIALRYHNAILYYLRHMHNLTIRRSPFYWRNNDDFITFLLRPTHSA